MSELKSLRKARGLSQKQAAALVGCKQRIYAYYESGERRPRPNVAEKIRKAYGLTLSQVWAMFYTAEGDDENNARPENVCRKRGSIRAARD